MIITILLAYVYALLFTISCHNTITHVRVYQSANLNHHDACRPLIPLLDERMVLYPCFRIVMISIPLITGLPRTVYIIHVHLWEVIHLPHYLPNKSITTPKPEPKPTNLLPLSSLSYSKYLLTLPCPPNHSPPRCPPTHS
jgi:hypothetical protein